MGLWEKQLAYFGNLYLDAGLLWYVPVLLLWYLPPVYPAAPKRAASLIGDRLADCSGFTVEGGGGLGCKSRRRRSCVPV